MIPDLINGCFEVGGGFILLFNVRQLYRDKQVKGVHLAPTAFFTSWGLWNLFYYSNLDQWFSFAGGISLVLINMWWLILMAYYSRYPDSTHAANQRQY